MKWATRLRQQAPPLLEELRSLTAKAVAYSREHLEDPPEINNWVWPQG